MKQKKQNSYRMKHADKVPYHCFVPYKTRTFRIPRAVMNDKNFTLQFYMTASAQVVKKVKIRQKTQQILRQAERDDSTSAGNRLRSAVHVVALPRFAEAPLISEKGILRSRSAAVVEIYCFTSSIVKVTSN